MTCSVCAIPAGIRRRWRVFLALLAILTGPAARAGGGVSHDGLTAVLARHVQGGRVDYAALKARPAELDRHLDSMAAVSKAEFDRWAERERLAFLINAYNAWTLRLILDHHPVQTIKDIGSFLRGPWDIPLVKLFGGTITLNTLEHQIIRKEFAEPRIHFALVCAAKGCPVLRSEAYTGAKLEEQLTDQTRQFLAAPEKNRVDAAARVVYLSPIFKWYVEDFEAKSGSVLAFLKPFWPGSVGPVDSDRYTIRHTEYDWSLNGLE